MSATPAYGTGLDMAYAHQPPWAVTSGDSLQYELFFGERFVSVRALRFPSCQFISAWLFDDGVVDLFSSYEPLVANPSGGVGLHAANANVSFALSSGGGQISINSPSHGAIQIDLKETVSTLWRFPPDDVVIHQPLLQVSLVCGSEKWSGQGYAKRYTFGAQTEHMSWRFITGPLGPAADPAWLWTAEASFDLKKYDYFKLAMPDGQVVTAEQPGSWHRDRMAHGVLNGVAHDVEIEDLGRIERLIKGPQTNLKLSQAFCRMTLAAGGDTQHSHALNEIACGSHA